MYTARTLGRDNQVTHELIIQRGPLPAHWRAQVIEGWGRYDPRLRDEREWEEEFERGPAGPAVHALVVADGRRVVGHHCAIPIRLAFDGGTLLAGKGEALYVHRTAEDRGGRVLFQGTELRFADALTRGLYARYREFDLEAYFGYATAEAEQRHLQAGCGVVLFPYRRFFAVHAPGQLVAGSNLSGAGAWAARAALKSYSAFVRRGARTRNSPKIPVNEISSFAEAPSESFRTALDPGLLTLDPTPDQLDWRFPGHLYRLLLLGDPPWGYAVLTAIEKSGRRRVVDWLVPSEREQSGAAIARTLANLSKDAAALEWTIPVNSPRAKALAKRVGRSSLVPDPRRRSYRMVVHGGPPFTEHERWLLTLSTHERF